MTQSTPDDFAARPGFALPPAAPLTGPFPGASYLGTWWRHRSQPSDQLLLVEDTDALLPAMVRNGRVTFLGEANLTDYHSPLGTSLTGVVAELASLVPPGTPYRFDSMPAEAAAPMREALVAVGSVPDEDTHEVAAVLALPDDFDTWLANIGKKERHETRRKRRRFEAAIGAPRVVRLEGGEAVASFAGMHRESSGDKGAFMNETMEAYFGALHEEAGAVIDALVGDDDVPVAMGFGFEDDDGYYLYNSAYDPAARDVSPGVVLVASLIDSAIDAGRSVFDFLKGDETYKFRLGASERPLHVLSGTLGPQP